MVEQIEEFGAEFNSRSLMDGCSLEYSEIKVVDSGSAEYCIGTRLGAEAPLRWRGKASRVEPLGDVLAASSLVASGYNIWTNVGDAQIRVL